jgi:hypothetical protein
MAGKCETQTANASIHMEQRFSADRNTHSA